MLSNQFFSDPQSNRGYETMDTELEGLLSQISKQEYELFKNEKNLMRVKEFFK